MMRLGSARRLRLFAVLVAIALFAAACTSSEGATNGNEDPDSNASAQQDSNVDPADGNSGGNAEGTTSVAAPDPDATPIDISDDIRVGVLDNGLTYYVQSNDSPGGSVSMRLAVRAGALHENPIGTGSAHFLEHMLFNGTEQFPGASLDATLRSIGAEIGRGVNARTSANSTVYELSLIHISEPTRPY